MAQANFWDDQASAQGVISEVNRLKAKVQPIAGLRTDLDDVETMLSCRCGGERRGAGVLGELIEGFRICRGVWIIGAGFVLECPTMAACDFINQLGAGHGEL